MHIIPYQLAVSVLFILVTTKSYQTVKPTIAIVCDFLQAHYPENISLTQLAEISGLSRFYLSRRLDAVATTGGTPATRCIACFVVKWDYL